MDIDKNLLSCLPSAIQEKISQYNVINEIRIRADCPVCFTIGNKNHVIDCITKKEEVNDCLKKLCKNSVYTYSESIKKGYVPFENGYRIGVCGQAITDKNMITNITSISSLNIRIPTVDHDIPQSLLKSLSNQKSTLIYSPANYGKTTFLRTIIRHLSSAPHNKKIAVIDTKNEIYLPTIHEKCPVDFFRSYPKYEAMNIAIQTMSPEVIVCDEIGIQDDITPLIECKNCGINLICSTHARTIDELLARQNIYELYKSKTFDSYIGINFNSNKRVYTYKTKEEIDY